MTILKQNKFSTQIIKEITITALLITIYRLGIKVPLPFLNEKAFGDFLNIFGLFNINKSAFLSILALGIMPYVSSYVLVEILSLFLPFLKKLRRGDYEGRRKLKWIAFGITLPLGILQGIGIVKSLKNIVLPNGVKILTIEGFHEYILLVTILVAGVFFLVLIAELISKYGMGNGISILLFSGICADYAPSMIRGFAYYDELGPGVYVLSLITVLIIAYFITQLLQTKGAVSVKHTSLKKSIGLFQFNTCPSGIVPITYAISTVMLPVTLSSVFGGEDTFWGYFSSPASLVYNFSLILILCITSYLFAWLFFHPARRLKRMRERGWHFPQGDQAPERYLSRKLLFYNLPWTMLLCVLAVLPQLLIDSFSVPFYIGGSTLYVVIAIGLDIVDRYKVQRQVPSARLVKIAEFHDVYDATMIKKHMESKGIISHFQGYYHRHLLYFFGPFIDISLMVPATDADTAQELLRNYYKSLGLLKPL